MSTPRIGSSISTTGARLPSARANSAFCWLPPDSDRIGAVHVRRPDAEPLAPVGAERRLRRAVDQPAARHVRQDRGRWRSRASTRAGTPRRPAGRRRRRRPRRGRGPAAADAVEIERAQHLALAVPGEPGEPDDLAAARPRSPSPAPTTAQHRLRAGARRAAPPRAPAPRCPSRRRGRGRRSPPPAGRRPRAPSFITTTRSLISSTSDRMWLMNTTAPPAGDEAPDMGEQLAPRGSRRATRSARRGSPAAAALPVVEERDGDLHHLPLRDAESRRAPAPPAMPCPGKIRVEHRRDRRRGPAPPAAAAGARAQHPDVLGHRQVRAERQLLEDAAQPGRPRRRRRRYARRGRAPSTATAPASGASAAVQDVDQRRLAGAVVADQPDALAGARPRSRRRRAPGPRRRPWRPPTRR